MAATLRASRHGLEIVDQARKKKGWNKQAAIWAAKHNLKRFWRCVPIDREAFVEICEAVGIENWEEIADQTHTQSKSSYIEFTVYDDDWVGEAREKLIEDLSKKVSDSCRILILVGITGIGKTAFAERLVWELRGDWIEDRENFENRQKASDFASVAVEWLTKWGEHLSK